MNLKDYNADSICQAVGLGQFVDLTWSSSETAAIRAVLTPSFHPEVVITLTKNKSQVQISVTAPSLQIWSLDFPKPTRSAIDQTSSDESTFSRFVQGFDAAASEAKKPKSHGYLDGVGIEACYISDSKIDQFKAHVTRYEASGRFVVQLTKYAWESCNRPEVKNALAKVAGYVDLKIPPVQVSESPLIERTGILILGTPEEKNNLSKALENHSKRGKR